MGAGGLSSIDRQDVRDHVAQFHQTLDWTKGQIDYFRAVRVVALDPGDPRVKSHFDLAADDPQVDESMGRRSVATKDSRTGWRLPPANTPSSPPIFKAR